MLIVVGWPFVALLWQLAALPLYFCQLESVDAIETGQSRESERAKRWCSGAERRDAMSDGS